MAVNAMPLVVWEGTNAQHEVQEAGAESEEHQIQKFDAGADKAWMKTTAWTNETTDGRV